MERCSCYCKTALAAVAVLAWMTATAGAKIEKAAKLPMKGAAAKFVEVTPRGVPCCDSDAPPQCDGDANGDGAVDPLDAGFVLARFGDDAAANCTADANCDGAIDPLDSGYVLARLGTCGAVPECQQACGGLANDECGGAEALACGGAVTVDNTDATNNAADPVFSCKFGGPDFGAGSVWYTFVADSAFATLSTCNSLGSPDTLLAVYDGTCGSLVEIGCNDDAGCGPIGFNSELSLDSLTPGNTYYVQVAAWDETTVGEITLELDCTPPPVGACCGGGTECTDGLTALECQTLGNAYQGDGTACDADGICESPANDDCANATPIFDGVTAFDTTDATDDGPADCTADTGHQDIWFTHTITGAQPGALRISLCDGTAFDTTLSIYEGTTCVGASLGCSDDDCGVGGGPSEVVVALGPESVNVGDTILIRVGGWNDLGGNADPSGVGQITIDYVAGGDCCVEHGPPGCDFIDVDGVDPQDVEDCVCAIDSFCCDVTWDSACLFIVENNCGIECPLCPSVGANDECVCAEPISCGDVSTVEIVDYSQNDALDPDSSCEVTGAETDCPIDGGGPYTKDASWWYLLTTGPTQTSLHLSMCSTADVPGFDTVISIWDADLTCDGFVDQQEVGCDDDFCTCEQEFFGPSDVCADVQPNHSYYILVDHYSGTGVCDGPGCFYTLEVGCDDGCVDH